MRSSDFIRTSAPWLGAGALLTFLSSFGQTFFISVFAGEIRTEFGLTHGAWGGIYSLGTMVSAGIMVWAGTLTDRFRIRSLGIGILAMLALAAAFMALNPYVALLPLAILGLRFTGQGMMSHMAAVAMARWFVASRGRALAIAALGFSVGEAILPLMFVGLLAVFDWRDLWLAIALVTLAFIPLLMALLRTERTPAQIAQSQSVAGMNGAHWRRGDAVRHRLFWLMIPALLGPSSFVTAFFFHQVYFSEIKAITHLSLTALFPVFTGFGLGAMIISGWALDKWGTGRLLPFSQIPMVVAFLLFASSDGIWGVGLGLVFMGISAGANTTLPTAFWAEFYGTRHIGAIKSLAVAIMVLGSAIGPGLIGGLIDLGIGLEVQYVGAALFFVLTTACMFIGVRPAQRQLSGP